MSEGIVSPGATLGSYRIERLLGRGGMGAVFLAYDTSLRRRVAIKILSGPDSESAQAQLAREARSAAALNHPSICTIHEIGESGGAPFIAMEYVEGRSIADTTADGPLPIAECLQHGLQAADALAYAHDRGVVHRDFKAANAIVTPAGRVKIIDFGLARRTDVAALTGTTTTSIVPEGVIAGTPYAMAPEQVRGEAATAQSDIWSLGVLLYEMAAGRKPFTAPTVPELFSTILRDPPAPLPPAVPVPMRSVIERCLEKDPARRYQHARDVHDALAAVHRGAGSTLASWQYRLRRHRWAAAAACVAVAAAVLAGVDAGGVRRWLGGPAPPIKLAVLPFENLTGDPDQDYLSDGLTEETIARLGRLQPDRLIVMARTSSMRYKSSGTPIEQIARELGVEYVLEGSARREGSRVRINASLVRTRDHAQRWSDSFEGELTSVMALQSDVARGVARALALVLLPAERARLDNTTTLNPEAYEAYLRGRSHAIKLTRADLDAAMKYYELAIAKDPAFALGYAGIAGVWSGRQQMGFVRPHEAAPHMKAAAAKAHELDSTSAGAHVRLAIQYTWTDWNWAAAEKGFTTAIDLEPNDAEARAFYAHYLHIMRRPSEGQRQMQRAIELDPLSELVQSLYGVTLIWNGRYEEAIANARNVLRTTPESPQALNQLATASYQLGRHHDWLEAEKRWWRARGDPEMEDAIASGFAQGGYRGASRSVADTLAARTGNRNAAFTRIATSYIRAGDNEKALHSLEQAFEAREPNMPYINTGPAYAPLRGHPRFQALVRRMNLPE